MKLEYLQEFLALSEIGNYTLAAENCFVSESTLSRHIMSLEQELHTELFSRTPQGAAITEEGRLLVPFARSAVSAMDEYARVLKRRRSDNKLLSIGFAHCVPEYGFSNLIYDFRREAPDVQLAVTETNSDSLWKKLLADELDFILCYRYDFIDERDIRVRTLERDTLAVLVPEGHPLSGRTCVPLTALDGEHFISQGQETAMSKLTLRLLREAGCIPSEVIYGGAAAPELVSQGFGVSLMEKKRYQNAVPSNVRFLDLENPVEEEIVLAWRDHGMNEIKARYLSFIAAHAPAEPPGAAPKPVKHLSS